MLVDAGVVQRDVWCLPEGTSLPLTLVLPVLPAGVLLVLPLVTLWITCVLPVDNSGLCKTCGKLGAGEGDARVQLM